MAKKVVLTWEDINSLLDKIHKQTQGKIDMVTGIPRGGTLLAIMYSHRFNVAYLPYMSNHYERLLIIDDIADSGITFTKTSKEFPNCKYAAIHYKNTSTFKPDFYGLEIPEDYGWIVYPWEKKDSKPIQDYLDN